MFFINIHIFGVSINCMRIILKQILKIVFDNKNIVYKIVSMREQPKINRSTLRYTYHVRGI